jgi:hypothetical protein
VQVTAQDDAAAVVGRLAVRAGLTLAEVFPRVVHQGDGEVGEGAIVGEQRVPLPAADGEVAVVVYLAALVLWLPESQAVLRPMKWTDQPSIASSRRQPGASSWGLKPRAKSR